MSSWRRLCSRASIAAIVLSVAACDGPQSILSPAGAEARDVARLFYFLVIGAAALWFSLMGIAAYTVLVRPPALSVQVGQKFIVGAGILLPTLVLAGLGGAGLFLMTEHRGQTAEHKIRVTAEQFWWRIEYLDEQGKPRLETANELVLPVEQPVELTLETADVIHSFWVPALAGKVDMIPGHTNRLVLVPEELGTFRGQCAEFCGASHALMAFTVTVVAAPAFDQWLRAQQNDAHAPPDALARAGQSTFLRLGCGACHSVRGTPAQGRIAPDLTHVASRPTLGAATLENSGAAMRRWLSHTEQIKPGVAMPSFDMLDEDELASLAHYLGALH